MAKSDRSSTMADVNRPASDAQATSTTGGGAPEDRRTVAPTPDQTSESGGSGNPAAGHERSMLDTAKERVAEEARQARQTAAETAEEKAERLREAGEAFESDSYAREAVDRFADGIGEAARTMRDADFGTMADDLSEFARRQPLVFYGGAALLGFAAARMLKASDRADERPRTSPRGGTYDTEPYGTDPWGAV